MGNAKPALQQVLEGVASVLGLNHGRERLELIFADAQLELYYLHHEKRRPGELAQFDDEARWLGGFDEATPRRGRSATCKADDGGRSH